MLRPTGCGIRLRRCGSTAIVGAWRNFACQPTRRNGRRWPRRLEPTARTSWLQLTRLIHQSRSAHCWLWMCCGRFGPNSMLRPIPTGSFSGVTSASCRLVPSWSSRPMILRRAWAPNAAPVGLATKCIWPRHILKMGRILLPMSKPRLRHCLTATPSIRSTPRCTRASCGPTSIWSTPVTSPRRSW